MGLSYYMSFMFSQLFVGRPSSTWILGFLGLPVIILKPALIGLLLGSITWLLFRPFHRPRPLLTGEFKIVKGVIVFLIIASAATGIAKTTKEASRFAPRIVYTSGEINKVNQIPFQSYSMSYAVLTWESSKPEKGTPISWKGDVITVYSIDDSIIVTNQDQILNRVKLGNGDIRYISDIYASPVRFDKSRAEYLAVLVEARAIRDCYILLIFDSQNTLSFQEILKRTKSTTKPMRKITNTADGQEILLVDDNSPLVYKGTT